MFDFAQARTNMVDCQIHTSGVVNPLVLQIFETLPREIFLPEGKRSLAYMDEDVVIDGRLFMMEPMVHARLLNEADIQKTDVVLDIGFGSGYSTAVLSSLATTVLAVEDDQSFLDQALKIWNSIDACNIVSINAPLTQGGPENAPYDLIFINGSVSEIPVQIVSQLKEGGHLYCILREKGQKIGKACSVRHLGEDRYSKTILFDAGTPYAKGFEPKAYFDF